MYKKAESEYPVKYEKKDDMPSSMLNQHISQLARSLYSSEKRKSPAEKKYHFPNLDCTTFKQKASHLTLIEEIYLLVIRMEVAELKLAQLDRKIAKKLKSLGTPKEAPEGRRRAELVAPASEENEPHDQPQRANDLTDLKENIKMAIDAEFRKFILRPCKALNIVQC